MSKTEETTLTGAERRRTQRIPISFRIEVCGREPKGTLFQDETTTLDVNEHGCKFDVQHQVDRGDVVTIRHVAQDQALVQQSEPIPFQIVWSEVCENGWTVGAMKLQDKSIWPITFPSKISSEEPITAPS